MKSFSVQLTFFAVLIIFSFNACKKNNTMLEVALLQAGPNRFELEKVLQYYSQHPEDSLKYQAAIFLIENMPNHHYYEGKLLDQYSTLYDSIATTSSDYQAILDGFRLRYGPFSKGYLREKYDIQEIDSAYLVNNIEWAFKVWTEQPWGKNVEFDDFCEYILPYRIGDEQPSEWREWMYKKYNPILDDFRKLEYPTNPLEAAKVVIDSLSKQPKHFTTILPALPHAGPILCEKWRSGSCQEIADLTVYILRALGIPSGIDYIPIHARGNSGHVWSFFLDESGNTYTSDYLDPVIGIRHSGENLHFTSKVYRKTFSRNVDMENQLNSHVSSVPPQFQKPQFIDVTSLYTGKNRVSSFYIPDSAWYNKKMTSKIVYLCVAKGLSWVPIDWSFYNKSKTKFNHVKTNIVFRLATWEENNLKFQSDPFIVKGKQNQFIFLKAKNSEEQVCLFSKYEVDETEGFLRLLLGGAFEGDNHPEFQFPDTLLMIREKPNRLITEVEINSSNKYRYVRYKGSSKSHCNISEIAFYSNSEDTVPLQGKILGTPSNVKEKEKTEYVNALDGDPYTSFDYINPEGGWVGLDLGKPVEISKITYIPRNRDNFIRKGDTYELFYLNEKWISVGLKTATSDSLLYENIPKGTLLYLKNHTRGKDERIFTCENGKQEWW